MTMATSIGVGRGGATSTFTILPSQSTSTPSIPLQFRPIITPPRPLLIHHRPQTLIRSSIDVDQQQQPPIEEENDGKEDEETPNLDTKRSSRADEKFAVVNTGIHDCRSCGFRYDEAAGDPSYPIPPGLPFNRLPEDWRCPTCGASKNFFESKRMEIAGFAQNQQFGLGGNSLTSGQKTLLIYGSLLLGFAFFLSGYFLQ